MMIDDDELFDNETSALMRATATGPAGQLTESLLS
jgi:hypothetical protein